MQATKTYPARSIHEDNVTTSMAGLKKQQKTRNKKKQNKNKQINNNNNNKTVRYAKISAKMANPREVAGNAEEEEEGLLPATHPSCRCRMGVI